MGEVALLGMACCHPALERPSNLTPTPDAPPVTANSVLSLGSTVPVKVIETVEAVQLGSVAMVPTFDVGDGVPMPWKTLCCTVPMVRSVLEMESEQVAPLMVPSKWMVA